MSKSLRRRMFEARVWARGVEHYARRPEAELVAMATPGKCHIDAEGWLRGPIDITYYTSPNHYDSGFAVDCLGMVQHTEDGFTAGTVSTFMSTSSEVSSFFGVSEDGSAQQFLPLGRGLVAWAEVAGNSNHRSTEFEDMTQVGHPMTAKQIAAGAQILEACAEYDGFPLQATDDPVNGRGVITHGDGGEAWGGHFGCPGDVRKAQRPLLISMAQRIRSGAPTATIVTADGTTSLHELCAAAGVSVMHALRLTLEHDRKFGQALYDYGNGVLAGKLAATAPLPKGTQIVVGKQG